MRPSSAWLAAFFLSSYPPSLSIQIGRLLHAIPKEPDLLAASSPRVALSHPRSVIAKGTLYFQDKDAELYALSADKGKVEWTKDIGGLGAASPAYSHGVVYAVTLQKAPGVDQGEALALRAKDGKVLWRFGFPGRSETSPIVIGSHVVVGSESGDVYSLDRKTGTVDWQVHTAGAVKGGLAYEEGPV